MRLHPAVVLACIGSALSGIARAQDLDCPVPSYEECTSDSRDTADPHQSYWQSSCGAQERDAWATGSGTCAVYASDPVMSEAAGSQRFVYLPPSARRNGRSIAMSRSAPYSYASHYSQGLLGSYANLRQRTALHALVRGLDVSSLPGRAAWNANGLKVASCDEYVYEKYYDYTLFEDTVAVAAGDARAIFEAAYAPGAIGDRAVGGHDPASKSRGTSHDLSSFGSPAKNVYFELARSLAPSEGLALLYPPTLGNNETVEPYPIEPDLLERIARARRVEHDLSWHWQMSQALADQHDDLLYAMAEKQKSFAKLLKLRSLIYKKYKQAQSDWAETVGECYAEVPPDAHLPNYDDRVDPPWDLGAGLYEAPSRFGTPLSKSGSASAGLPARTLQPRAALATRVAAPLPVASLNRASSLSDYQYNPAPPISRVNPNPGVSDALDPEPEVRGIVDSNPGISDALDPEPEARGIVDSNPGVSDALDPDPDARASIYALPKDCTQLPDLDFTCSNLSWSAVIEYAARVAKCLPAVDAQIAAALEEARADGCLEPDSVTPCDWSPALFVRELEDQTLEGKEASFTACQRFTGDDFSNDSLIKRAPDSGGVDMRQSTEHVDRYIADIKAAAAKSRFPIDPSTGRAIFGAKTSDSAKLGNRDFGVGYSYDIGWKLANLDEMKQRICATEVDVKSYFDIKATVFGITEPLVVSDSYLRTDNARVGDEVTDDKVVSYQASLIVMGDELVGGPKTNAANVPMNESVKFPALHEQLVKRRTLLEAKAHFAIGPIPVSISAGASGEVGVELSLDGEMQFGCVNPRENPTARYAEDNLSLGAHGRVRPYAALNGFATAAVDLGVASAGVRADLTLVNLSVPFNLRVAASIQPGPPPTVDAETDLTLVLETLSGRISVFIDSIFGEVYDETIFRWDGPRVEETILKEHWAMDLELARHHVVIKR